LNIAFDIDGVYIPLMDELIRKANEMYGLKIKIEDVTKYEVWECTPLTEKMFHKVFEELIKEDILRYLKVEEGAQEVINKLYDNKDNKIYHITAREVWWGEDARKHTIECLTNNDIQFDEDKLILDHEKTLLVDELNLDCIVEDTLYKVKEISEKNGKVKILLMDRPWNQCGEIDGNKYGNITRVYNWKEIGNILIPASKEKI